MVDWLIGRLPKPTAQNGRFRVCASPMRKPCAKALCTRVLLKYIYKGFLNGGAAGRPPPPVEDGPPEAAPLVDISLRRTLVHRAFA